jgi:hypothetical protein
LGLLVADNYRPRVPPPPLARDAIPAWLAESALGDPNRTALASYVRERDRLAARDLWLAVVPGASEQWGHHRAPPAARDENGTLISDTFRARLELALRLLDRDIVRYVLVSGGAVDRRRPEYNEALRGRAWLESQHGPTWSGGGSLGERIFVDPLACHSTTNLRNAARFALGLGLDRIVIATSMPPGPLLWPRLVPVVGQTNQGWYFLHHRVSTFDLRCRRSIGYTLGTFEWFSRGRGPERIDALVLRNLPRERLLADTFGP